jgi:sialate O-acetylesterase
MVNSSFLRLTALCGVLALVGTVPAQATVRLPALVGPHMVLQRDRPVPIWGWAAPGEAVSVLFRAKTYTATAGPDGRWQAIMLAQPAGGPFELTVKGENTVELTDVLVGDVWLASGQSNMHYPVKDLPTGGPQQSAAEVTAAANFPAIRFFTVDMKVAAQPQAEVTGSGWEVCSPATAGSFSAVAYFFSRSLHQQYKVPMGVIVSSWGGTPAQAWVSTDGLRNFAEFQLPPDARLTPPTEPQNGPAALYNGMIAPLLPCVLKGVIWYQGESNLGHAVQYRTLFPALVADWRAHWNYALPFLFVQLPNMEPVLPQPAESEWAELREAQTAALELPRTGMATTIDIGEADNLHPANKQEVGRRLALVARHVAYADKAVVHSGPTLERMTIVGASIRLTFGHLGGGLLARGGQLRSFAVAGADRKFHWATATMQGNEVVLKSAAVPKPVAVRYGWANNPNSNLYNREGLPAPPFRTDEWPGLEATRQ